MPLKNRDNTAENNVVNLRIFVVVVSDPAVVVSDPVVVYSTIDLNLNKSSDNERFYRSKSHVTPKMLRTTFKS